MRWPWSEAEGPSPGEGPRVGIVTPYEPRKGLATLSRGIEWALGGRARVFPVRKLSRLDRDFERVRAGRADRALRHARVVPRGTRLRDWLRDLDLLLTVERAAPRLCAHCREIGVRSVVVALPDWLPEAPAERVAALAGADACVLYGAAAARQLRAEGLANATSLPLALDAPLEKARPTGEALVIYFNVGVGGPLDRRQVRLVLEVMGELLPRHPSLHLLCKLHPQARGALGSIRSFHPRMRVIDREIAPEAMRALLGEVDVTLFPSRFEGVGYPLLESLHAGVPVLATDAAPMNEVVRDGVNGLLIAARPAGRYGALEIMDVDRDALCGAIERCVGDRALVDRMKAGAGTGRAEAARSFRRGWARLVQRLGPRALNLGAGEDGRPGSINVDIRRVPGVDVVASAEALPFADASLDAVLAQDLLEHFPGERTGPLLDEWVRVLRPGGALRVQTPDVRAVARALLRGRLSTERAVEWLYGAQDHAKNFHFTGFDEPRLRSLLAARDVVGLRRRWERVSSKNLCLEGRRGGAGGR